MYNKVKDITRAWCVENEGKDIFSDETKRLVSVLPTKRQLDFLEMRYYNFIHFGMNTFYGREWGDGTEKLSAFNPKNLNTDQWCEVLKKTGSKGIIITAKHHDGFCLFETKYTDHNVMNTPFGKDIVKLLSESCKKYSLKLGIYLSPWDRHEKTYGTKEYNDFFCNQLTELCENYGDVFCFWFDGACGEGENGRKQIYDWERYYGTIRRYQPNAVINICGPDVRWIGNEGGRVRKSEYSVIPLQMDSNESIIENSQHAVDETIAMAKKLDDKDADLGSRELLSQYSTLVFKPAEADVSINHGWFHTHKFFSRARKKRTAKQLAKIFFDSVGGNASMLLNVPPDRNGLINKREIKRLEEFAELIKKPFKNEIETKSISYLLKNKTERENGVLTHIFCLDEIGLCLNFKKEETVETIFLQEDLSYSQRTESFDVYAKTEDSYSLIYSGTVIGSGKIIRLKTAVITDKIIVVPTQSRCEPTMLMAKCFSKQ